MDKSDNIFISRFIDEVIKIATTKEQVLRIRMRFLALLSLFFGLTAAVGTIDTAVTIFTVPEYFNIYHMALLAVMLGTAATFLLTALIFGIAFHRNSVLRKCLGGLKCTTDRKTCSPGEEITVSLSYTLKKKPLNECKLEFACVKETFRTIAEVASVKIDRPYKEVIVLSEKLTPDGTAQSHDVTLKVPDNALLTQKKLTKKEPMVVWDIVVYFDFLDWYSYEVHLPVTVV